MIVCWFCHNSQFSGVPCDKHMELPTIERNPAHYADDPEIIEVDDEGRKKNIQCKECGSFHWDYHDYCVVCTHGIDQEGMYDWCVVVEC